MITVKVPFKSDQDMNYVQRMNLWAMQQSIKLRIRQQQDTADLQFSGEGQAMNDLKTYLSQR